MKESKSNNSSSKVDLIKSKVSAKFQESKQFVADYLNEKVNKLSATHKRLTLLVFGLIIVAICMSMIIRSMNDVGNSISIEQITLPKDIYPNDEFRKGFKKILRIKTLLDSLKKSPGGITVYDSLMKARPGLIDSLHSLISSYQFNYSH